MNHIALTKKERDLIYLNCAKKVLIGADQLSDYIYTYLRYNGEFKEIELVKPKLGDGTFSPDVKCLAYLLAYQIAINP